MNTERENNHGEYWADEGIYIRFNMKKLWRFMKKFLFGLLFLVTSASAQECFYPAHNLVGYSSDLTNATGWTRPSTITDDTATTTPPEALNISKTYKGVGVATQSNFLNGNTGNKYVTDSAGYTLSAYVKFGTFQWVRFGVTGSATWACNYDVQNGAVGSCVGLTNPTIASAGNGWFYITADYTGSTAGISGAFRLVLQYTTSSSNSGIAMVGGETIYFTGFQAQDNRVPLPERKKYVNTVDFYSVWSNPVDCVSHFRTW